MVMFILSCTCISQIVIYRSSYHTFFSFPFRTMTTAQGIHKRMLSYRYLANIYFFQADISNAYYQ